jgi:hypothetical protein
MTKRELEILDGEIQYLCNHYQDRIKGIRELTGINPGFTFLREAEIIESLYKSVLEHRKQEKSTCFSCGTSGWHITYLRNKKTYKKGEKFVIKIYFSFVEADTYE